jgi:surface protein
MYGMFYGCSSLASIPDISKWNIDKCIIIKGIFYECHSLSFIPDIFKWKNKNIININNLFNNCIFLSSLPFINQLTDYIFKQKLVFP